MSNRSHSAIATCAPPQPSSPVIPTAFGLAASRISLPRNVKATGALSICESCRTSARASAQPAPPKIAMRLLFAIRSATRSRSRSGGRTRDLSVAMGCSNIRCSMGAADTSPGRIIMPTPRSRIAACIASSAIRGICAAEVT